MAQNVISVGSSVSSPIYQFDNDTLMSINADLSASLDNEELKIDRLSFVAVIDSVFDYQQIIDSDGKTLLESGGGQLVNRGRNWKKLSLSDSTGADLKESAGKYLSYMEAVDLASLGTAVYYHRDGELKGKYYLESITKSSANTHTFDCVSAIGILDTKMHDGGVYVNETIEDIIDEIIGDDFDYYVDDSIKDTLVNGWLPYATKRENLHQLLFAYNVLVIKSEDGQICFTESYSQEPKTITADYIFTGGSVDYSDSIASVTVAEHTFYKDSSVSAEKLFDSSNYSGTMAKSLVEFKDAPIDTSTIYTDGTLVVQKSTVNYAIVSGNGALYGKPYTHIENKKTIENSDVTDGKDVNVSGSTLISPSISANVLNRIYDYYTGKKTVKTDFVLGRERCGSYVTLTDVFGDVETGYIETMSYAVSNEIKASCELISGYVPNNTQFAYNKMETLTGSGTWSAPSNASGAALAILIAGGDGGDRGVNGTSTAPGTGGDGGEGGKVYKVTISSISGLTAQYSCGTGGTGGDSTTPTGGTGGATTFGSYTSESGTKSETGHINKADGIYYGKYGTDGESGSPSGGNASDPSEPINYGSGGNGGNGGGQGTTGNIASDGTDGKNGCIILYYKEIS